MKSSVVWDITIRSPLKFSRFFGGKYHLHLQGRGISQVLNKQGAGSKQSCACYGLMRHSEEKDIRTFIYRQTKINQNKLINFESKY
jgi:hypothetical protein